jgi:signal transduction histidine kinase/CheY-like chemotaxis protein
MSTSGEHGFEQWAEVCPEPTLLVSRHGSIEWANAAARTAFGDARSLAGQTLSSLVHDDEEAIRQYLRRCSLTSSVTIGSMQISLNGKTVRWRCEGFALRDGSSATPERRIVVRFRAERSASERFELLNRKVDDLAREIRERKRVEREHADLVLRERAARDSAERANRLKDEFLSTLSHELRTPLSAILGWTYLMRAGSPPPALQRGLETIERNARLQSQLIDDLLDLSSITSGKLRLNLDMVDPMQILNEARDSILPASAAKRVEISTVFDESVPKVSGDSDRFRQIVWNLLSNAVKFTPEGGAVQLRLRSVHPYIEIAVSDNGQGISADVLPYIFERFRQGDSSSTRKHRGLGLGLAIVRYLAELHGGRVGVESEGEGCGSTFTVYLPVAPTRKPGLFSESVVQVRPDLRSQAIPRLHGTRILLIEDDPDSRELLCSLLEMTGASVVAAGSAEDGLRTAQRYGPDLIVSDIEMPGMDGYAFIRRLREREQGSANPVPAIALTAYARAEDRARALEAGFHMHLSKPVNPPVLLDAVALLLGRAGAAE